MTASHSEQMPPKNPYNFFRHRRRTSSTGSAEVHPASESSSDESDATKPIRSEREAAEHTARRWVTGVPGVPPAGLGLSYSPQTEEGRPRPESGFVLCPPFREFFTI